MFTIFIEVIISIFVVNFKAKRHPYLISFIKGMLVAICGFLYLNYFNSDPIPKNRLFNAFLLVLGAGVFLSLILMFFVWLDSSENKPNK